MGVDKAVLEAADSFLDDINCLLNDALPVSKQQVKDAFERLFENSDYGTFADGWVEDSTASTSVLLQSCDGGLYNGAQFAYDGYNDSRFIGPFLYGNPNERVEEIVQKVELFEPLFGQRSLTNWDALAYQYAFEGYEDPPRVRSGYSTWRSYEYEGEFPSWMRGQQFFDLVVEYEAQLYPHLHPQRPMIGASNA